MINNSYLHVIISPQIVKEYLDDYFQRSSALLSKTGISNELCLLCVRCFEVSLLKLSNIGWNYYIKNNCFLHRMHCVGRVPCCL